MKKKLILNRHYSYKSNINNEGLMNILVCYDENLVNEAEVVAKKLLSLGYSIIMDSPISYNSNNNISSSSGIDENSYDMIVSVGGDGTMLRATRKAIEADIPIFGVNAGRVGFLSAFDYDEFQKITKLDIESLNLTERILLEVLIEGQLDKKYLAVNDVVISRNGISKNVELKVYSDKQLIGEYRGDGIIVSTPTGSTGYSLSAGGPIVDPLLDIMVVTPICAHTMFVRSIALDGKKKVKIEASSRLDSDVYVSLDSTQMIKLNESFIVSVIKSNKTLKLLSSVKRDYFEVLNKRIGSVY